MQCRILLVLALAVCVCASIPATPQEQSFRQQLQQFHQLATHLTDPMSLSPLKLQVVSSSAAPAAVTSTAASFDSLGMSLLKALPRWGFPSKLGDVLDKGNYANYGIGVGIQAAYGIVLAILTFFVGCCFCCCRCCCNWCGGREPEPEGYTKCQRWGVFVLMFLFTIAVGLFILLGWFNNNQMSSAISGDKGIMSILVDLVGNVIYFLNGTASSKIQPSSGVTISSSMSMLLNSIGATLLGVIGTVQSLLGQTGVIFTGVPALIDQIAAVGSGMSNAQIVVNGTSFSCSFCQTVGNQVTSMSNQLRSQTSSSISSMQSTVTNTNNTLVSTSTQISSQLNTTLNTLQSAADMVQPQYDLLSNYKSQASTYDGYRNLAVLVILLLPLTAFLALLCGGLCKSGCPFTCFYWFGYFASFLIWILFTIHLPLAVVLNDTCTYVSSVDSNLTQVATLGSAGQLLNACLYNQSLVSVYNLQGQLNFTSAINFPTIPDLASQFQFSAITNFTNSVMALNLNTFGFYPENTTAAITAVNAFNPTSPPAPFDRTNIDNCPGQSATNGYEDACRLARTLTLQENSLTVLLNSMKANASALNVSSVNLKQSVSTVYNNIFGNLQTTLAPLFGVTTTFTNAAYCGFIGVSYFQLKTSMCTTMVTALAMLALCSFAIGLLNFAVIVCSTVMSKRMGAPMEVKVYPVEDQIELVQQQLQQSMAQTPTPL